VVRTIGGLCQVHGVLVVLALRRVYATATANNTHEIAQDVEPGCWTSASRSRSC
jgi:hypothetical protein